MGTAGAIKKVEEQLRGEPFLVINADTYRAVDLRELVRHHEENPAAITMLLQENRSLDPGKAVWVDRKGTIVRFLERYGSDSRDAVPADFLGVQVMEPRVLSLIPPDQPWDIHNVYLRLLDSDSEMRGSLQAGYWKDLGTLAGYREIHMDGLNGSCPIRIPANSAGRGVWVADGTQIESDVRIEPPVFIGVASRLRQGATIGPYTVVGGRCTVGRGARVARSILWDGVHIEEDSCVEDLVVSRDFRVPLPVL